MKVAQTSIKPASNDFATHIVTTLRNSHLNSRYSHLRIRQLQKYKSHSIAAIPPFGNHPRINMSAQRGFKSKTVTLSHAALNLSEHNTPRLNRRTLRLERRQPRSNEIDINKIRTMRLFHQVLARKGGLAGTVRPSNHYDPLFIGHLCGVPWLTIIAHEKIRV